MQQARDVVNVRFNDLPVNAGLPKRATGKPDSIVCCEACGMARGLWIKPRDLFPTVLRAVVCPVCSHAGAVYFAGYEK